jgi:hypothetical protein
MLSAQARLLFSISLLQRFHLREREEKRYLVLVTYSNKAQSSYTLFRALVPCRGCGSKSEQVLEK